MSTRKICPPEGLDAPMMKVNAVNTFDREDPIAIRQQWRGAMECNNNDSFNFDARSPMPSEITQNGLFAERARNAGT